eukprot:scaffold14945_cov124-Skeletonema_marinoi.AAC.3
MPTFYLCKLDCGWPHPLSTNGQDIIALRQQRRMRVARRQVITPQLICKIEILIVLTSHTPSIFIQTPKHSDHKDDKLSSEISMLQERWQISFVVLWDHALCSR